MNILLEFISQEWMLVSLLLVLFYIFVWHESKKGGPQLSCAQVTWKLNRDEAVIIDVRDSKEYKQGHITGAKHIPINDIDNRTAELQKHHQKQIIIVDKMGQNSSVASKKLLAKGFNVSRLKGGMLEWSSNSLPCVKS